MAKLVDALCSGRSARKGVLVRIQFWAQKKTQRLLGLFLCPIIKKSILTVQKIIRCNNYT